MTSEFKTYENIHELPLDRFIRIVCDNDLKALIIEGEPSEEMLAEKWGAIYEQYIEALNDKEQQYMIKLQKDIYLLESKITLIELIVTRLSIEYNPDVLAELKKIVAVRERLDSSNPESYKKDLELVVNRSKRFLLDLEMKKKELQKLVPDSAEQKIDRQHFDMLLIRLGKHLHFHVNKFKVSVGEFVAMVVEMRTSSESMYRQLKLSKR